MLTRYTSWFFTIVGVVAFGSHYNAWISWLGVTAFMGAIIVPVMEVSGLKRSSSVIPSGYAWKHATLATVGVFISCCSRNPSSTGIAFAFAISTTVMIIALWLLKTEIETTPVSE